MNSEQVLDTLFPSSAESYDHQPQPEINVLRARLNMLEVELAGVGWLGRILRLHRQAEIDATYCSHRLAQLDQMIS